MKALLEQLAFLPEFGGAHLELVVWALLLGAGLSLPLGITVSRRPAWEGPVLGFASVVQTVPGLALLALMVPALAQLADLTGLALPSIGRLPALIALTLYSMLPMLRNTVTGLAGVDPASIEAARGVGMTDRQRLWRVEIPLALPVIVAGVRTAAVWVVGTATLATPVGATSLGNYIFGGLQTRNWSAVVVGSAAAALLAIAIDALVRALERGAALRRGPWLWGPALVLAGLVLWTALPALSSFGGAGGRAPAPIAIGSKSFTEQYVLAEILRATIEEDGGRETRELPSLGSTVAFDALRSGELDVYVDYSGTIWATILKREGLPEDRSAVLAEVERALSEEFGIEVAAALGFENTYAVAVARETAERLALQSIHDLARHAERFELASDYEFFARPEWSALRDGYALAFGGTRSMDPALMYEAVKAGQVGAITAFSTDGRIAAYDLAVLTDPLGVIPPYDAIVLVGPRLAREAPEIVRRLRGLAGTIDAGQMQRMNWAVDGEGRTPGEVGRAFRNGEFRR